MSLAHLNASEPAQLQQAALPAASLPGHSLANGSHRLPKKPRRNRALRVLLGLAVLVVVASGAGAGWVLLSGGLDDKRTDLVLHKVRYEPLQLTIVERGALESADNRDVIVKVKAGSRGSTTATTIKWVIDNGTQVVQGQKLVDLDDSGLQEQRKAQRITVDQAHAGWISASENFKIVESQNLSDTKTAEIALDLAKLDLQKYVEGDYLQTLKDIEGRTLIEESNLDMWRDRVAWSQRMVQRRFMANTQAQAERSRLRGVEINLAKVREERRVLDDYTYKRTKIDWESKVAEAGRALDRVKQQASAKDVTARADLQAKKSIYEQEVSKLQELSEEIQKCVLTAPQDGLVVYYMSEQSRWGGGSQQSIVAQGEPVREGQKLMSIPDLNRMVVNTRVHEAMVSRVKGERTRPTGFGEVVKAGLLVNLDLMSQVNSLMTFDAVRGERPFRDKEVEKTYSGQAATVRVEAYPDRPLRGHVKSVATVASQADWSSSDVKVYQTMVAIDEELEGLKPGMSAEVTILTDSRADHVLTIPVQAIIGAAEMGRVRKCFLLTESGPEEREIEIGLSNEKMAEVRSGLKEGEDVVLNPRALLGEKDKVRIGAPNKGGATGSDAEAPNGGGRRGRGEGGGAPGGGGAEGRRDGPPAGGPGGAPGAGPGGPVGAPGAGPGAGPGGAGGGARPGAAGAGGGGQQMSQEERQRRMQQFEENMKKATPEGRKALLQGIPEQFREQAKQRYKGQGLEIAD